MFLVGMRADFFFSNLLPVDVPPPLKLPITHGSLIVIFYRKRYKIVKKICFPMPTAKNRFQSLKSARKNNID